MPKKRIMEAMVSQDADTQRWKMRFSAARMAYEEGKLREAESLLARLAESAENLKEHTFATNAVRIGMAAVQICDGRTAEAKTNLERTVRSLEGAADPVLQEVYAVALRFLSQVLADSNDERGAEQQLKQSISVLERLGEDASVQLAYSLSDLSGLYAAQGRFSEANQYIVKSIRLLAGTVGIEDREYVRAEIIYSLCRANPSEVLDIAEACGVKLQYQFGVKHPTMVRAIKRYVTELKNRGESARLEEAKNIFSSFDLVESASKG